VDHLEAVAAAEVGDRVADGVALEMADVGLSRGVGQHLQHVGLALLGVEAVLARVGNFPGPLLSPKRLPPALDLFWLVARHQRRSYEGSADRPCAPTYRKIVRIPGESSSRICGQT
jgi:hypothetical protein